MSNISATGGSFNIGEVIATGVRTLNQGWIKLIGLTILPWVLAYALAFAGVFAAIGFSIAAPGRVAVPGPGAFFLLFALFVLIGIAYFVCQAALVFGVVEQLRGRSYSFGRAISVGTSRIGRMIGIGLIVILAYVGIVLALGLLGAILPRFLTLILAGAAFLIGAPMVICAFFVLFPVASVEENGVFGSFGRSRFLTRGYRWPILGLLLVLVLAMAALNLLVAYIVQAALPILVGALVNFVIGVWLTTLFSVIIAVAYFRLRYLKEGINLDEIANVFD